MDFLEVKKEACASVTKNGFKVKGEDNKNLQLFVTSLDSDLTFSISCPTPESNVWSVWSEHKEALQLLQSNMDMLKLETCNNVSDVIQSLGYLLNKAQIKSSENGQIPSSNKEEYNDCASDDNCDDEEDEDDYYMLDDIDAQSHDDVETSTVEEDAEEVASNFFNSKGSQAAVLRLVNDLKSIQTVSAKFGISGQPRCNNLFMWNVELTEIPSDTKLGKDLLAYQKKYNEKAAIKLDVQFPPDYPFKPPFIRVLKPRFKFLTGHITIGGSICMEALTNSGWCPANDIESILIQVRTEILSDPAACLDPCRPNQEYSEAEARDAFSRMVKKYGWT